MKILKIPPSPDSMTDNVFAVFPESQEEPEFIAELIAFTFPMGGSSFLQVHHRYEMSDETQTMLMHCFNVSKEQLNVDLNHRFNGDVFYIRTAALHMLSMTSCQVNSILA